MRNPLYLGKRLLPGNVQSRLGPVHRPHLGLRKMSSQRPGQATGPGTKVHAGDRTWHTSQSFHRDPQQFFGLRARNQHRLIDPEFPTIEWGTTQHILQGAMLQELENILLPLCTHGCRHLALGFCPATVFRFLQTCRKQPQRQHAGLPFRKAGCQALRQTRYGRRVRVGVNHGSILPAGREQIAGCGSPSD